MALTAWGDKWVGEGTIVYEHAGCGGLAEQHLLCTGMRQHSRTRRGPGNTGRGVSGKAGVSPFADTDPSAPHVLDRTRRSYHHRGSRFDARRSRGLREPISDVWRTTAVPFVRKDQLDTGKNSWGNIVPMGRPP
jgi:hypothetical protein